jgi:hypothetical protein
VTSLIPRIGLAYFALLNLLLGAYASIAPRYYFEHFPGAGRAWVALDGPYNEHLMRDYGALNLALGVVAACALVFMTRQLIITAALAEIVYAVPHVIYHLAHRSRLGDTSDQVGAIGGLSFGIVIGVVLLLYAANERQPATSQNRA